MSSLWQTVSENVVFVLEFLALIVVMFLIAYVIEKAVKKKNNDTERVLATRKIVVIGVFSANCSDPDGAGASGSLRTVLLRTGFFRASGADRCICIRTGGGCHDRVL